MRRLLWLDTGEEFGPAHIPAIPRSPGSLRLKLLDPLPPFRLSDVVHVLPIRGDDARPGDLVLSRSGDAFRRRAGEEVGRAGDEVVGRLVALERGGSVFSFERGLLALVPSGWLSPTIDLLEVLRRLRHPFTPSLYLGGAETCLAGVRDKYDRAAETRQYAALAPTGLEPPEREMVERHVKSGGRILDVGCGGGREALALARAGFQVTAIDIAPRMVEAARANAAREGLDIAFGVQSATELDEPPGSFDGAYWAGSYHHIPGRALRVEALRRIVRALTPDGVLILMVAYREPRGLLSRSRLVDFLRGLGASFFGTRRLSEPGDGYMRETSQASDPREACFFHNFSSPHEVRAELEAAGLSGEEVTPGWWVSRPAFP